jgi:mannose-6-phosphate isomerase-like protein (cupin superfamily)
MNKAMTPVDKPTHRKAKDDFRWEGVEQLPYKEDERALFKSITRQVLFSDPELHGELRYFEVAPAGFSTLERHEHMHAVLILRGRGHCLVGSEVRPIETRDLVTVPALTWHQFRATGADFRAATRRLSRLASSRFSLQAVQTQPTGLMKALK